MKNGWQQKSVGEILQLEYGKPLDDSRRKPNGRFPVYGANGEKDRADEFYHDRPSIIVGRKGSAGEINLTEEKFWPLDVTYFVTFDEQSYDLRFLYYLLKQLDLTKLAKGVKPGINRNEVYSQVTKAPRLPEQQRLVTLLDQAFEAIAAAQANTKKNFQNAHALFASHLQSTFKSCGERWPTTSLDKICDRVSVGHVGPTSEFYCDESVGIPFIRSQNVRPGRLDFEGIQFVTKEFHARLKKSQLRPGDLLFVRVGANRSDCCYVPEDVGDLNCANIVFARPTLGNAQYLARYCQSAQGRTQLLGMTTGSAQGVINTSSVAELVLPLPPPAEQFKIIERISEFEQETQRLTSLYQQKLTALAALKKSLLHQAFTGQL